MATTKLRRTKGTNYTAPVSSPGRTVKMAMPICDLCQHGHYPQDWYLRCPHNPPSDEDTTAWRNAAGGNPYISYSDAPVTTPTIEINESGERIITGSVTKLVQVVTDNLTQIPYETRHDSGRSIEMAKAGGCRMPEELGIAPYCQFRECWSQDIKIRNAQFGDYCSEMHAKLSIMNILGEPLEVIDQGRRTTQLQKMSL